MHIVVVVVVDVVVDIVVDVVVVVVFFLLASSPLSFWLLLLWLCISAWILQPSSYFLTGVGNHPRFLIACCGNFYWLP